MAIKVSAKGQIKFMEPEKEYRASDFEILLDVKSSRVRKLLGELSTMGNINKIGNNRDRRYKLNI